MPRKKIPAPVPAGHKWCFQCAASLPFGSFETNHRKPDGLAYCCRRCRRRKAGERAELEAVMARGIARIRAIQNSTPPTANAPA